MRTHSIDYLFDKNKIQLITVENYKLREFSQFCKTCIVNKEIKSKYLIGLQTNTFDWLIDCFQQISQSHSYHSMYNYVCKLLNKLI